MKTDKTNYLIMELNVKNMIEGWMHSTPLQFDFLHPEIRKKYINVIDSYDSCPLFDQLEFLYQTNDFSELAKSRFLRTIPKKFSDISVKLSESHKIDKALVFLDCTNVINQDILNEPSYKDSDDDKISRELINDLFIVGFSINYGDEDVHYIPFDKSNSMSKKNKISFIDERLYHALNDRLLFDIGFKESGYQIILSKFFAYKGLYMSSSVRTDRDLLISDAKDFQTVKNLSEPLYKTLSRKIIVIDEKKWDVKCKDMVFYGNLPGSPNPIDMPKDVFELYTQYTQDKYTIENLFDGEGIISPNYARLINMSLNKDKPDAKISTSFQIRMPFIKGMLHQVDFKDFLNSYVPNVKKNEPIYILDYFGIKRDLREAEIIIPLSMFKWGSWIKEILKDHADPMQYYFEKFIKYEHSLYIANTNTILGKNKFTTLNYQFLNTLKLEPDQLKCLLDSHIEKAMDPYTYLKEMSTTDVDEEGNPVFNELSSSMAALLKNRIFEHQKKIDADLRATSNSLVTDIALGRIIVDGQIRFLSRDLLIFLTELLNKYAYYLESELKNDNVLSTDSVAKYQKQIDELKSNSNKIYKESSLHSWTFYMPYDNYKLDQNSYYSIFRSPHLSRNEQCALMPFRNKIYDRYFSHLTGVIMLSVKSLDHLALGGADFDGDFVKIVSNKIVTQAVLDGAYAEKTNMDKTYYIRKLPIVNILSQNGAKYDIPDTTNPLYLKTIANTFDSKVGNISNAAIRIGQLQYAYDSDQSKQSIKIKCQDCTILTGLEIDAAKTGYHPDINIDLSNYISKFEFIDDFKKKIDKLKSDHHFHFTKTSADMIASKKYVIKYHGKDYLTFDDKNHNSNLAYLPQYFFKYIGTYNAPKSEDTSGYIYFPFMGKTVEDSGNMITKYDRSWKKSIDKDLHQSVASVVLAYQKITELMADVNRYTDYCKKNNTMAHIRFILNLQYDNDYTIDYIAETIIPKAYATIEKYITDITDDNSNFYTTIDKLIQYVRDNQWAFMLDTKKYEFIRRLFSFDSDSDDFAEFCHSLGLPASDEDTAVFTGHTFASVARNFNIQGYNLLYLILLDIKSGHSEFEYESDVISYKNESLRNKYDDISEDTVFLQSDYYKDCYNHLLDIYSNQDFLTQKDIKKILLNECKAKIDLCFKQYYDRTKTEPQKDDQVKVLYGVNRFSYKKINRNTNDSIIKVDGNYRFFWDYFSEEEILPLVEAGNAEGDRINA